MLKLQIQGGLHLGVEDHLDSSLTTGESRAARTLPHNIRPLQQWPEARLENLSAEHRQKQTLADGKGEECKSTFQGVSLIQSPIISNNSWWHAQASSSVKAGCISNSTPNIARQEAKCLSSTMLLSALQITKRLPV